MRLFISFIILIGMLTAAQPQDSGNQNVDIEFFDGFTRQKIQSINQEADLMERLERNPDSPLLQLELARFYQAQRFYAKALNVLKKLVTMHPEIAETHFRLGQIYSLRQDSLDQALEVLQNAIQLAPDLIEYREEIISVYYRLQRYSLAINQLDEILKRDPINSNALYRKAVILHNQGNIAEAESMIDNLPHHEHARVLKAIIVQQRGENAEPIYEAILRDYPQNIRARYEYGKILVSRKKYSEAQEIFEKIIDEDPFYQHAIFQLVRIFSIQKEKTKAQLAKQSLDAINQMGRAQRNEYRSYLRHHPDTAETHFNMGIIYLEIGRGNLAAQEFRKVQSLDPNHGEAPFFLAQILMASGNNQEALSALELCLNVRNDQARIHALMAQCYLELQDAQNAMEQLNIALKLDPNDPLATRIRELWQKSNKNRLN